MPPRPRRQNPRTTIEHEPPAAPPAEPTLPPSTLQLLLTAFAGLGYALSARALLLLALIGAFVLAVMAMQAQTQAALMVFAAYALGTVVPVTYLEIRRRNS